MNNELFPLRIVVGERFCGREQEKNLLKNLIIQKRPTVLISPRRYGKTSLVYKTIDELKYPYAVIDFLTSYDDASLCNSIVQAVSELIAKIMPVNMKAAKFIEKCIHGVKVAIGFKLFEIEFVSPAEKQDPIRQVLEVLKGLEKLAHKLNKTVVLFFDEFQRIIEIDKGQAIQGAIRNVAQIAKNVAFVFSGSSRHMLSQAFDDSGQPLYMMCEKIHLERIAVKDYIPYIQDAAVITWNKKLEQKNIEYIIELTERHPFYINYLCSKLWKGKFPVKFDDIDNAWHECLLSEERRLIEELDKLTISQRQMIKEIANAFNLKEPTGIGFLTKLKMASGTATPILQALKKKDMIYVENGFTKVLDPLLKYFLTR